MPLFLLNIAVTGVYVRPPLRADEQKACFFKLNIAESLSFRFHMNGKRRS